MKTLEEVREYLNDVPYIHQGGCAISALAMKRWLKKNHPIQSASIVYSYGSDSDSFEVNDAFLNKGVGKLTSCMHAYLLHKDELKDCGSSTPKGFVKEQHIFKDDQLVVDSINNFGHWNPFFKRTHIIDIAKDLDIDLSDVMLKEPVFKLTSKYCLADELLELVSKKGNL